MKACLLPGMGGINQLIFDSIDIPVLQKNHALIKVSFCGINHLDVLIRQGKRPSSGKFPHILGSEITGEIVEFDSTEKNFKTGDKVAVYPWTFDGTCIQCKNGNQNICEKMGTIGRTTWGGYAEYVLVPVKNLLKIPSTADASKICAGILAGTTALHLIERAGIKNNSQVLITGATGGVGTLILQILKNKKCKILAATSHPKKAKLLLELGVDFVVSVKNLSAEVKQIFPQGVEYAIDLVGGDTWSKALDSLGKNGTMVFCATSKDDPGMINIGNAFAKQLNILGSYGGTFKNFKMAVKLIEKGELSPVIDSILPLKDAKKAHQKIEGQKIFGKILLKI